MAAEEAAKQKRKNGGGSRASGGTTVVTLAGDNSRPKTLFIPAGSRTGSSLSTTTGTAIQTSGRVGMPTALPQTPARLARRGGTTAQAAREQRPDHGGSDPEFSLMSDCGGAVRRVLESIKPDMEALIRRALDKIASDRRRTAYA